LRVMCNSATNNAPLAELSDAIPKANKYFTFNNPPYRNCADMAHGRPRAPIDGGL
jgi:hypothetical protein